MAADIWMPDFCFKLHPRRLEGILVVENNLNYVFATLIRRVSGAKEPALESCERRLLDGSGVDAGVVLVLCQVLQLLDDAAIPAIGHCGRSLSRTQRVVPVGQESERTWSMQRACCRIIQR